MKSKNMKACPEFLFCGQEQEVRIVDFVCTDTKKALICLTYDDFEC